MSPTKSRPQMARLRPRSEIYVAVAVGVGIVATTLVLVWALRPGTPGIPGTGGILVRQPRVSLWVALVAAALGWGLWFVLRSDRRPRRLSTRNAVLVVVGIVAVAAVLSAVFWPGGLVKHYQASPSAEVPIDPTGDPALDPSGDPSLDPTGDVPIDPTGDPAADPGADPGADSSGTGTPEGTPAAPADGSGGATPNP